MSKKGENIYKRKDKRWEARYIKGYDPNGSARYGYCYGKTYREAKEKVERAKATLLMNVPSPEHNRRKRFSHYCDEWLRLNKIRVKESTYVKYNTTIEKHIKPKLGGCFIQALSTLLVLQDLSVASSKAVLDTAIAALAAQGVTRADLGMKMAENIFANNTVDLAQRDRITIMFTDGSPTTGSNFETNVANKAIESAKKLKNDYSSTVYTVGVFDGADASSPSSLPANDNTGSNRENRYMHLVSSNYLNATSMTNTGALNPKVTGDNSYYLSASDSTALNDIFQAMSSQIGSTSMDLGMQTVVKDIVTPQFDLPQGVNSVTVKQVDCISYNENTGVATWGTVFMDYRCHSDYSSLNTIIYGHNMKNDSMFGTFTDYKSQGYYDEHPVLWLLTPEVNYKIELMAGYVTPSDSDAYSEFISHEELYEYIQEAKNKSTFSSPLTCSSEDRIVTLSTCSYEYDTARYVLVGKLSSLEDE